ncbi:MAG: hypothetical protein JNL30_06935 [Rubrivivax sp.]|nr:hypothetical protein [Rubrivivax sp.]
MAQRYATATALAAVGALGAAHPAPAQPELPDLVVLEVRAAAAGVRIGRCNAFEVLVRNAGTAAAAPTRLRLTLARPGLAQAAVDTRTLALAELGPGQQRVAVVSGVHVPEPGPWRIEAVADAAQTLVESNEGNNAHALEIASMLALCPT